jgi:hypothetical protein
MGPGTVVRRSFIHHNGQLGIHGGQPSCAAARGLLVENSELSDNNTSGYNWDWESGAAKWTNTDGPSCGRTSFTTTTAWGFGPTASTSTRYTNNVVRDNYGSGINHELGYAAVIRDNLVTGNGFQHPIMNGVWGSGIIIDQSRDVQIYNNNVEDKAAGITAVQEPAADPCGYGVAAVVNLSVHDNVFRQPTRIAAGVRLRNESDQSYYWTKNNEWVNNDYILSDSGTGLQLFLDERADRCRRMALDQPRLASSLKTIGTTCEF